MKRIMRTCPVCQGTGVSMLSQEHERWSDDCWRCKGQGEIITRRNRTPGKMALYAVADVREFVLAGGGS